MTALRPRLLTDKIRIFLRKTSGIFLKTFVRFRCCVKDMHDIASGFKIRLSSKSHLMGFWTGGRTSKGCAASLRWPRCGAAIRVYVSVMRLPGRISPHRQHPVKQGINRIWTTEALHYWFISIRKIRERKWIIEVEYFPSTGTETGGNVKQEFLK